MHLKKLNISGFKSFVDPVEVVFDQGVTGIVGPNGCGKSNISDAIRWVLGEQNPRRLRGNVMGDMIFNGTSNRAAAGMAEVSITFDNEDNYIPISYREVQITRRLHRDGESEYLINQTKCRMKDITDLFMDSGIGTNCYSILEQGRVDMIVNAKPQERRELIEEAAGVSRFLHCKMEALRKLERTEQDLLRVEDILNELQRRRRSLERQAKQAELAKKYKHELVQCEYTVHQRSGKNLMESLENTTSKLKGLQAQVQVLSGELVTIRSRKNALTAKLQEQDAINQKQRESYALANARLEQMENHLQHLSARETEYGQMKTKLESETEADSTRCQDEQEKIKHATAQAESLQQEIETLQNTVQSLQTALDEMNRQFHELESGGQQKQKQCLQTEQRINELTNQQRLWERDCEHIQKRLTQLAEENERVMNEITALREKAEILAKDEENTERQTREQQHHYDEIIQRLQEKNAAEKKLKQELNECEREWQKAHSRLESLRALQANLEGFEEGVRYLLRGDQKPLSDLLCTVAERIQVLPGYEQAVNAALALKLQAIVAENPQAIQNAVTRLREEKKGRVAFLPLQIDELPAELDIPQELQNLQCAADLIRCDDSFHPVIFNMLRTTYLIESLEHGFQLQNILPSGFRLLTMEGDLIESDGTVTGGFSKSSQILDRTSEIKRLDEQAQKLHGERTQLEHNINTLQSELSALNRQRDEVRDLLLKRQNDLKAVQHERQQTQRQLERIENSNKNLLSEQTTLHLDLEKGSQAHTQRQEQLVGLQKEFETFTSELETWQTNITEFRTKRRAQSDAISERRMELLEKQKDCERWAGDVETRARHLSELERGIEEKKRTIEQQEERRIETQKAIAETKQTMQQLKTERDGLWQEVQKCESINQELRSDIQKVGKDESDTAEKYEQLRDEQNKTEQDHIRLKVEKDHWNERMEEAFGKLENREELERDERTTEELKEKVDFYCRRIEQLGMVNELAIEEYEEVKVRCEFLETQQSDLVKAKEDLVKTARELHGTTKELFMETFNKVKENFNRMFRRIFNGGKADIRLMEGDPMEAGIEIEVQPPGKKLQSITLLSGGEKAMVAVSLLFAIYEIKPSPFCFLDEIDAPLDDVNIGRFTTLLGGFLDRSQFIMITHNKRTMSVSDAIYGVTMPQEGISTVYSMQFDNRHPYKKAVEATQPPLEMALLEIDLSEKAPLDRVYQPELAEPAMVS